MGVLVLSIRRNIGRAALRAWGRLGKAPGYHYQAVDRFGHTFAGPDLLESRLPNGCRVRCDLRDEVQRHMWFYGVYEPIEAYLFTRLLQPGMVVFDCGANVGQYSMLAATAVGPEGSVHSFEPIPSNFARLKEHVDINELTNVRVNRLALWDEDKKLSLGMPAGMVNNAGAYSVRAASEPTNSIEAQAVCLDSYFVDRELKRLDLIKMDIEGAEPFAIRGGLEVIEKFHPTILIEINRTALNGAGSGTAALWQLISGLGYRAWRIAALPQKRGPVRDLEEFTQGNAIFHHDDLPAAVTSGWDYRSVMRWARSGL